MISATHGSIFVQFFVFQCCYRIGRYWDEGSGQCCYRIGRYWDEGSGQCCYRIGRYVGTGMRAVASAAIE